MKKKKTPFQRIRNWLIEMIVLSLAIGTLGLALYMVVLSSQIETRFAGRRWDIPSKVFSETTLIYAGQAINRSLFLEKLRRLGYREVSRAPGKPGEMRTSDTALEIFLHSFRAPFYEQKSRRVQIRMAGNHITTIIHRDTGNQPALLELEPEELMLYFGPDRERRLLISIEQLPKHVIHAILAAEDHRFFDHHGVELRAIARALITNLRKGAVSQGGSTISQQLAKNYFLTPARTLKRKLRELLITGILEYRYEKNEILEIYLNEIYWGQKGSVSINGIGEAAQFYFDKPAEDLSVAEAATLAGLIKAPNHYSPYANPARCSERRNGVLKAMEKQGWIQADALKNAMAQPLAPAGYAGYRRRAPYFMDYLTRQLTTLYTHDALASEGLSIFTTIDTQVQMAAEQALTRGLGHLEASIPALANRPPEKRLQGAVVVMQPKTGYILALVGGREYGISQFNRATQARRQPGSAFKPFVYLAGLDTHPPLSRLSNAPKTYMVDGMPWRPKNFSKHARPEVTLREALAQSHNLATVNLALEVGLERISDTARRFYFATPEKPVPAMALGAIEVSPLALARAYCTFAANGVLPYPLAIKEVVGEQGRLLESRHAEIERVISPAKAYIMTDLLRSVVQEGTARSLRNYGVDWPVAGKTGTTNDSRDAWFVGYTPNLLALVWVGFDDGESISATGSRAALPIWADLMNALPQYESGDWFSIMPPGVERAPICLESGQPARENCCPRVAEDVFLVKNKPNQPCGLHTCKSRLRQFLDGIKKIVPNI